MFGEPVMILAAIAAVLQVVAENLLPAIVEAGVPVPDIVYPIVQTAILIVAAWLARARVTPVPTGGTNGAAWLLPLLLCGAVATGCAAKTQYQATRALLGVTNGIATIQQAEIAAYCSDPQAVPCPPDQRVQKPEGGVYVTDQQHRNAQEQFAVAASAIFIANDALEAARPEDAKAQIRVALAAVETGVNQNLAGLDGTTQTTVSAVLASIRAVVETIFAFLPGDPTVGVTQ